jgi:preprotein translocase subunit SecE
MTDTDTSEHSSSDARRPRGNIFSRLALFIRQVVVELRKVIWPTRKELIAYTTIVIVFVAVVAAIIAGFDYIFTKGVLLIFG